MSYARPAERDSCKDYHPQSADQRQVAAYTRTSRRIEHDRCRRAVRSSYRRHEGEVSGKKFPVSKTFSRRVVSLRLRLRRTKLRSFFQGHIAQRDSKSDVCGAIVESEFYK